MNNQIIDDLNNIKIASERILQTVLDAKVGAKKIQVKRDVTELSRETETILNLENQRQSVLNEQEQQKQEQKQKKEQQKQLDKPTIEFDERESERDDIKDSGQDLNGIEQSKP
ncbi:hypothetical protein ACTFIV_005252 [Dictyostelium citrinum]